jgi:hypothetical protein
MDPLASLELITLSIHPPPQQRRLRRPRTVTQSAVQIVNQKVQSFIPRKYPVLICPWATVLHEKFEVIRVDISV